MADVHVAPMVDGMRVLRILFIVAAPVTTTGVPVVLTRTRATPINQEQEPITSAISPEGKIYIQETEVQMEELVPRLRAIAEAIGAGLNVPVASVGLEAANDHFGWLSAFITLDMPASSAQTRARLDWQPTGPGLLNHFGGRDYARR